MAKARHPKPYTEGPRRQITTPWKRRVLDKLARNKMIGVEPMNPEQLRVAVDAKKGGINTTLKVNGTQFTSRYADAITEVLEIDPPLVETDEDDEDFVRDVLLLRKLTRDQRRKVRQIMSDMTKT